MALFLEKACIVVGKNFITKRYSDDRTSSLLGSFDNMESPCRSHANPRSVCRSSRFHRRSIPVGPPAVIDWKTSSCLGVTGDAIVWHGSRNMDKKRISANTEIDRLIADTGLGVIPTFRYTARQKSGTANMVILNDLASLRSGLLHAPGP